MISQLACTCPILQAMKQVFQSTYFYIDYCPAENKNRFSKLLLTETAFIVTRSNYYLASREPYIPIQTYSILILFIGS